MSDNAMLWEGRKDFLVQVRRWMVVMVVGGGGGGGGGRREGGVAGDGEIELP